MKYKRIFCFALFSAVLLAVANGQSIQEKMTQRPASCQDVFKNAMNILPELQQNRYFDSLGAALAIWKKSCGDIPEVGCTALLLSIEESTFDGRKMDSST